MGYFTQQSAKVKLGVLISFILAVIGTRFFWVTTEGAIWFQSVLGYYIILALLVIWAIFSIRIARSQQWLRLVFWRKHCNACCIVVVGTIFLHVHEPHVMRVLYDEPSHAVEALVMHLDKSAALAGQSNYIGDTFMLSQHFPSFRQYLFPLLVSLLHDITGYRVANVFLLNFLLTPLVLLNGYFLGYKLAGKTAGLVTVGLLATFPLLAQVVTSGEYDVLNLGLLGLLVLFTMAYAREPAGSRSAWMNLSLATALLLALTRAESILYIFPWTIVTLVLWWRERRITLTGFSVTSPLFLLPNLMANLIMATGRGTAERLRTKGESCFDISYLSRHISEAVYYFFNPDRGSTSSPLLAVLGLVGFIALLVYLLRATRTGRARPEELIFSLFMVAASATYMVVLTQFWSSPIDVIAARFCLPIMFIGGVVAGWFVLQFKWLATHPSVIGLGVILWTILGAAPTMSRSFATQSMAISRTEEYY